MLSEKRVEYGYGKISQEPLQCLGWERMEAGDKQTANEKKGESEGPVIEEGDRGWGGETEWEGRAGVTSRPLTCASLIWRKLKCVDYRDTHTMHTQET